MNSRNTGCISGPTLTPPTGALLTMIDSRQLAQEQSI